jgi:hypothetical protein
MNVGALNQDPKNLLHFKDNILRFNFFEKLNVCSLACLVIVANNLQLGCNYFFNPYFLSYFQVCKIYN